MLVRKLLFCYSMGLLLAGCASGPRASFNPTSQLSPEIISSQNVVKLSEVKISGDLKGRNANLYLPFVSGFIKQNSSIAIDNGNNNNLSYFDAELILNINTKSSLSATDYFKLIPIIGNVSAGALSSGVDFNWKVTVDYDFKKADGLSLQRSSFELEGSDKYRPSAAENFGATYVGIAGIVALYPDATTQTEVGDILLGVVGQEIAKRLATDPIRSYLIAREKQRDGMDIKTYADFLDKKKRLEKEREIAKADRIKGMDAQIKSKDQLADIKSGTVMILGIGVSKYQSSQIPALKYADRDSQRIVKHFKDRYKLSDDRAMLLTNENATAIKISRFITQNAAKLLSKDDTFILYFGGHGAPDVDSTSNDNDGLKKYLLLHDSELDSLPLTALSLNNLATLLGKLPCKRVIILLDSCFAGTAGAQTLANLKSLRISEKSYKNITEMSGEGRVILAASSENQVSHEEDSLQAGVFTHYLLEGLNGKADLKGDGKINILGLYEYVTREVSGYTQNKQSPVFRGTLDMNIVF